VAQKAGNPSPKEALSFDTAILLGEMAAKRTYFPKSFPICGALGFGVIDIGVWLW
jgi:hypothetical protein